MRRERFIIAALFIISFMLFSPGATPAKTPAKGKAGGKGGGMPPALVVLSRVTRGSIRVERGFVGTLFYREVADVASEVGGMVEDVGFEEGERVDKEAVLVRLGSELLVKDIDAAHASYEEALASLEAARAELGRIKKLYTAGLSSDRAYDESRFKALGLEKKAASIRARLERLKAELNKKTVRAPFTGVILKKKTARGEWVRPGETVASLADTREMDFVAGVPEDAASSVKPGERVDISVAGNTLEGRVLGVVPAGDVRTRTFPVRIRLKNPGGLMEGMEAVVSLPGGPEIETLIVPRDAIISQRGRTSVFAVKDGRAAMIPVGVKGYAGGRAAVASPALSPGMKVVVKGNERLRDGQAVRTAQGAGRDRAREKKKGKKRP